MDLFIKTTGVTDLTAAAMTSASDATALTAPDDFPQLVLGTSEPITLKFLSAASTYETWSDDPTYTMYVSLGVVTARGDDILAEATIATVTTDGKTGTIPVNTDALASYIDAAFATNRHANTVQLNLQVTVADPNSVRRCYAIFPITVWGRVASFDPSIASIPSVDVVTRSEVASSLASAQSAAAQALASEIAAELAKTNAETAETNAETAETNAEAAQTLAEVARDAASASQIAAFGSQTGAANSAGTAVAAASSASVFASAASASAASAAASEAAAAAIVGSGNGVFAGNISVAGVATIAAIAPSVTLGASGPNLGSSITARAIAPGLVLDGSAGATTSATFAPGSPTALDFLITPTSDAAYYALFSTRLAAGGGSLGLVISRATTGKIAAYSVPGDPDEVESVGTCPINQTSRVTVVFDGSSCKIYINGTLDKTASVASYPTTLLAAEIGKDSVVGGVAPWQGYLRCLGYNRSQTAAEVLSLYQSGSAGSDYNSAGTTATSGTLVVGKRYRLTDWITTDDFTNVGAASNADGVEFVATGTTPTTWTNSSVVTSLGLVLSPDYTAGSGYLALPQPGTNGTVVLPASGVAWSQPRVGTVRIRGTTATSGNEQLFGASVLLPAESQILRVRARSRSGTPSITIGTASGGNQIVASVALSTTWKALTIALTDGIVSTADDIWIGSNSADVVEVDLAYDPLDI